MYLFAALKILQVMIIHIKTDTIQLINSSAKNVNENTTNCSGRDGKKGSSGPHINYDLGSGAAITITERRIS